MIQQKMCIRDRGETAQADGLTVVTSFYPVYLLAANVTDGVEGVTLKNMTQPQTCLLYTS